MKKVLIFSLAYYPHVGGAEVSVKELTERMVDLEFHMITMRFAKSEPQEEKIGNVFVHRVGLGGGIVSKFYFQFSAFFKARSLNKKYHFDATWALMAHATGVPAALFKMANPRVPYVLNLQEGDPVTYIRKKMLPLWPLFRRAFTKADVVQPLSNYLADWARAMGFTGLIVVIPNGADIQFFTGSPIAHEKIVLVSTSRLVRKNALDDVISALPLLPKEVIFRNYGFGPDKEMLEELARKLGVEDRVELLPHPGVPKLPPFLHAADIFIRPSRSEGFGISFIEAMAAGLPVIATQEGGIKDFLFDAKLNPGMPATGFAVNKDSPEQIAAQVKMILGNPEATKEVIENARKMALQNYDWDILAKNMRDKVLDPVLNLLFKN